MNLGLEPRVDPQRREISRRPQELRNFVGIKWLDVIIGDRCVLDLVRWIQCGRDAFAHPGWVGP
jgi:hypothetical protein